VRFGCDQNMKMENFCLLSIVLKCSFIEYSHSARASFSEVAAEPTANPQKSGGIITWF